MNTHYVIAADHGHVRIFEHHQQPGQLSPNLVEVQSLDFPHGRASYTHNDTDMAGRFQGSNQQGAAPGGPVTRTGMSIDERLPMQREVERRTTRDVAETIQSFLERAPDATWDFAAAPELHKVVLTKLPESARARLRKSAPKDLVNLPPSELLAHFKG